MRIRAAFLVLGFALVFSFAALPARAQGDLETRVSNLEMLVAKLNGQLTPADLAGTFNLRVFANDLFVGDGVASIASEIQMGTVTLAPDFTGSVSVTHRGFELFQGMPWFLASHDDSGTGSFTWSYDSGTLTITMGSQVSTFSVAAGGRVLITTGSGGTAGQHGNTSLVIATRLQ